MELDVNEVSMLMGNCFKGMWLAILIFAEVSEDKIFKNMYFSNMDLHIFIQIPKQMA